MNTKVSLLFGTLFLVLLEVGIGANVRKCTTKDSIKADETGARIATIGRYGTKFAETPDQMTEFCRNMKSDLTYMESYGKECLNGTTKQLFSMIVFSFKGAHKNFCLKKYKKRINEMLAMGKCANQSNKTISVCLDKYLNTLYGISRDQPKFRVPQVCCHMYNAFNCVGDATKSVCPNNSEMIVDFLRNIFQSLTDVSCGDYVEHSNKCSTLHPPPKRIKSDKIYKSVVNPLIKIWDSLEDPPMET